MKDKKKYCKDCKYYIKFINNPKSESTDVCGYFLETELDPVGRLVFKQYGQPERCEVCLTTLRDDRKVVTRSCREVNHNWKCKFHEKISLWGRLLKKLKRK